MGHPHQIRNRSWIAPNHHLPGDRYVAYVPRDEYGMVKKGGRAVRHFMIDGKVYKSKKKFLEAIKDFNP